MSSSDSVILDIDQAWHIFYVEYGTAMVSWQILESELARLFSRLTKIPPDMAIQIFYSATSFNARTDIFSAALTASKTHENIKSLAHLLIGKAKQYSAFRNKFAHDQPRLSQRGQPAEFEIIMVHGRGQSQSETIAKRYTDGAIRIPEIREASTAFRDLANLIRDLRAQLPIQQTSLDRLHGRLQVLPTLPRPKDQPPKPAKPKRQRPPSGG